MRALGDLNILVVDDDEDVRELLRLQLRALGRVILSPDAYQGLAAIQDGGVDVVVLDLMLPGAGGVEFLSRLRAKGDTTPVVVLTGMPSPDLLHKVRDFGARQIVRKPHLPATLSSAVLTAAGFTSHAAAS
jgi:DNA-binding response OmpR family regulator